MVDLEALRQIDTQQGLDALLQPMASAVALAGGKDGRDHGVFCAVQPYKWLTHRLKGGCS